MPIAFIPFPSGITSDGGFHGQGLANIENLVPLHDGLRSIRQPATTATVTDGPITGCYAHVWSLGAGTSSFAADDVTIFAGTKGALYSSTASAFSNISRGAGYGTAVGAEPSGWRFASFGNDVFATNYVDPVQYRANNSGNFADAITSTFKPQPRHLAVVRNFLFGGNLNNVGYFQDSIVWSATDNALNFDASATTLAGATRVVSRPGEITGLVGGEYLMVFKSNSIHVLQFTGGREVFRQDEVSNGIGSRWGSSIVVAKDGWVYFFGGDGFYRVAGTGRPELVPGQLFLHDFVDTFFGYKPLAHKPTAATMAAEDQWIVGYEHPATGCLFWFYQEASEADFKKDHALVFNPKMGTWSRIVYSNIDVAQALAVPTMGYDSQDALIWRQMLTFGWDGTNSTRKRFTGGFPVQTIETQRWSIGWDGLDRPRNVRVRGVCPVFSQSSEGTVPPDISVAATVSNDPIFVEVLSEDNGTTVVNPRSDSYARSSANQHGWHPIRLEGQHWTFSVSIPVGGDLRAVRGLWVDYEVVN